MRWFLVGCIFTALGVGVYLFSPWFAPLRPAPPPFVETLLPEAAGTPTPQTAVAYTVQMSSWLAQLTEAQKKYLNVRPTIHTNAGGSQTSFNVGAAMWEHVCWEYGEAEAAAAHGNVLPSTRTYVARACDSLTQSTDIMQRAFEEGREADYTRGLALVERGFDNVERARASFRENR